MRAGSEDMAGDLPAIHEDEHLSLGSSHGQDDSAPRDSMSSREAA